MATHYYIPQTVFPVPIPAREYAELVARIPAGYVTTSKEIEMFLAHRHSAERVEYDGPLPKFYEAKFPTLIQLCGWETGIKVA